MLHQNVVSNFEDVSGKFDVFFSSHVLEHVPDLRKVFEYAASVLRRGGIFVAFTPNGSTTACCATPSNTTGHGEWLILNTLMITSTEPSFPSTKTVM